MLLNYRFQAFLDGMSKNPPSLPAFEETLPPWMRLALNSDARVPDAPYSELFAADVTLAYNLGILSQAALVAYRPDKLRKSGAFPKEKDAS